MFTAKEIIRADYLIRLGRKGIPYDPAKRTAQQSQTAALEFWAAQNQVAMDAVTLTQAAAEV